MAGFLRYSMLIWGLLALAGCGALERFQREPDTPDAEMQQARTETPRPEARPGGAARPPAGARTAAAFDTSTQAERIAALAAPQRAGQELGRTTASLGPPGEPGFWLRTGLVNAPAEGRISHAPSGTSVRVELRPSGAAAGSGSQLSLPAFRALGLPLTALPELTVFLE